MLLKKLARKARNTKEQRYGDENYNNREKQRKTNLNRYGFEIASKHPEVHYKNVKERRKKHGGFDSEPERLFSKLLKKSGILYKYDYYVIKNNDIHYFDFAIFKNDKLKCLVEIDGSYYHGLDEDSNGFTVNAEKDYDRFNFVPDKVKFLIIDAYDLNTGLLELKRILPMKYKDWKKEMLRSIPKNIEDAIPKFDKNRMRKDWKHLCNYDYNEKAFLGKSILLNFCRSRLLDKLKNDWKSLRKTLYLSPCSEHHLLEGFEIFKNTSQLKEKFRIKYEGKSKVIVKHHTPEKMLAICSLGKIYISKEPIDKESKRIAKFLKLKIKEI